MKSKLSCLLIVLFFTVQASAQDKAIFDTYVSEFQKFYNNLQYDSMYTIMSDRIHSLTTPEKMREMIGSMYTAKGEMRSYEFFKIEKTFAYYKVNFKNEKLQLVVSLDKGNKLDIFRFIPDNTGEPAEMGKGKSVMLVQTPTGKLYGTLTIPDGVKKVPVVLIIAGSGPTDRDGNNAMGARTNAYRMLADSLQLAGIASLRYDKRGVGASMEGMKEESAMRFNDMVNDAVAFIKALKADSRFSDVIVMGHSEGSLVGMIAAEKEKISKYISVAGAGQPIAPILKIR